MPGRNCADIVFCIDASGSMEPCLKAVCENIGKLLEGLNSDGQTMWDVRFDFLTFQETANSSHSYRSVNHFCVPLVESIYKFHDISGFFTRDLEQFKSSLANVPARGEEMQLLALDIAMDYPWRPSSEAHRVVVLLSDEPVETGIGVREQVAKIDKLIEKVMAKRIKLFIIAPESDAFYRLASADRCEYSDLESQQDGLQSVDFSKMLSTIGKSVSVSQSYEGGNTEPLPLFDQKAWSRVTDGDYRTDHT